LSYRLLRPILFALPPDIAHSAAEAALRLARTVPGFPHVMRAIHTVSDPALEMELFGIRFPNPVGLAAGYDKDARLTHAISLLGLGFTEVGTVTPLPQSGNPRPWLFRLMPEEGLINRAGFNNRGAAEMAGRFERWGGSAGAGVPVGINLGKNRDTPLADAASDYIECLEHLHPYADYFVVNVSSPNTPGLRDLQAPDRLRSFLGEIVPALNQLAEGAGRTPAPPLLVKISPDLDPAELPDIVGAARESGVTGFVATNTTSGREGLAQRWKNEEGGLSGPPLKALSTRVISELYRLTDGECPIIGVGGISSAEDAWKKVRAGASLVQVYTGLIYRGPGLPMRINRGLLSMMEKEGFSHLSEAVGADHRAR
jgi:dihydroorotate dehydrogenase